MSRLEGADAALGVELEAILEDLERLCREVERAAAKLEQAVPARAPKWWRGTDHAMARARVEEYSNLGRVLRDTLRSMGRDLRAEAGVARTGVSSGRELMLRVPSEDVSAEADAVVIQAAEALGGAKARVDLMTTRVVDARGVLERALVESQSRLRVRVDASEVFLRAGATMDELAIAAFLNPESTAKWVRKQKNAADLSWKVKERGLNFNSTKLEAGVKVFDSSFVSNRFLAVIPNKTFVGRPRASDVRQGELGDCWLMGSLAAIAHSQPWLIQRMVRDNMDGTYTVKFAAGNQEVAAEYSTALNIDDGSIHKTTDAEWLSYATARSNGAQWPIVIEKAYAQMVGGYQNMDGGSPFNALRSLLGGDWIQVWGAEDNKLVLDATSPYADDGYAQSILESTPEKIHASVLKAVKSVRKGDIASVSINVGGSDGVVGPHAFAMLGPAWENAKGQTLIKVYNPWGVDGSRLLPKGSVVKQPGEKNDGVLVVNLSKLKTGDLFSAVIPQNAYSGPVE